MRHPLIDLDVLDKRIKALQKPTPQQVVDLIATMYQELKEGSNYDATSLRH